MSALKWAEQDLSRPFRADIPTTVCHPGLHPGLSCPALSGRRKSNSRVRECQAPRLVNWLIPGLRVSFSKSGASLSIGHRGLWYTFGPHGRRRATLGLPGTGLYWTETIPPARAPHAGHRLAFVVVVIAACHALAGRMEQARDAADHLRKLDPAFRISKLDGWIPIRRPEHRASLANGLRLAGLPE